MGKTIPPGYRPGHPTDYHDVLPHRAPTVSPQQIAQELPTELLLQALGLEQPPAQSQGEQS